MVLAFTMLLIIGSVTVFIVNETWRNSNPDTYDVSYDYSFEGTMYGEDCTGEGKTSLVPESGSYHLYEMRGHVHSNTLTDEIKLGVMFDSDDSPSSDVYTFISQSTAMGETVDIWTYEESGTTYTLYVGDSCRIIQIEIVSEDHDIVGHIRN